MLRSVASRILSVVALLALSGCGLNFFEERETWRDASERACFQEKLVVPSYFQKPAKEIDGRGACGIEIPLKVNAFEGGVVAVTGGDVVLGCMMTWSMENWIKKSVQPAAMRRFGMPVTEILTMGTYSCRSRNNVHGEKLSEHAFANAFDVAGFRLANGTTIRVKGDWWGGDPAEQAFLRETLISACQYFTTVLGPGSNRLHEDHIHIDLAHHNAAGTSRYCRPKLQMPPDTLDPNVPMVSLPPGGATPVTMEQRAFTYRWDDNLGTPDATAPNPNQQVIAREPVAVAQPAQAAPSYPQPVYPQTSAPAPAFRLVPPASIPLSYAE